MLTTDSRPKSDCRRAICGKVSVKLETEYTIKQKLEPSLKAAGSSLADIGSAGLSARSGDFAPFNECARIFPQYPPATSVMPMATPVLGDREGRIEINAIALRSAAKRARASLMRKRCLRGQLQPAVRAGDLLFIQAAGDRPQRAHDAARVDPAQPLFAERAGANGLYVGNAQKLCEAAGTSLANVVRSSSFIRLKTSTGLPGRDQHLPDITAVLGRRGTVPAVPAHGPARSVGVCSVRREGERRREG